MKKVIKYFSFGLVAVLALTACSDQFLRDKKNYDNASTDVYNYVSGCNGRVNDIYSWCLPTVSELKTGQNYLSVAVGYPDMAGQSTEEYSGLSIFLDGENELSSMGSANAVPDFFMGAPANIQNSVYGRIRNINDCLEGIQGGSISEEEKTPLLGQVYFFRAWCYYNLVKWYGGVPIVKDVLPPVASSFTPRSTTKECIEFIIADLDRAAEMLKGIVWSGDDYGRVTAGTALALKGRVLLLWASPIFNRANAESRWQAAYQAMKQDLPAIQACGYGLYETGNDVNGSDFAKQFLQVSNNPEAVFVTLYNNIANEDGLDNQKNNRWEHDIRPRNTGGSGKSANRMILDLFPMSDGKIPASTGNYTKLETSAVNYERDYPFMNRDPRFYRTFAFPGFRWAYSGDPTQRDSNNPSYDNGTNYVLWNYKWYVDVNDQGNPESGNNYAADNLYTSGTTVYIRKKSDDYDLGTKLYNYAPTYAMAFYSQAPLIELRFTEVLLNLAEAACMAGHMDEAVGYLRQIRQRAGYTPDNDYGLQSNLASDQAACMSAILYERQIEFAYEGKRFDDMRRWMLYDGGASLPQGAPSSWQLTGWGGNTCTWLGYKPLNGQRRENIEFRTANKFGVGTAYWYGDPLIKDAVDSVAAEYVKLHPEVSISSAKTLPAVIYPAAATCRPEGVDFRQDNIDSQLAKLREWYKNNLVTSEKRGDGYDSQHNLKYIYFNPKYYLLGLSSGAQDANKDLPQTIGWQDYNNGGAMGTFDPLAE